MGLATTIVGGPDLPRQHAASLRRRAEQFPGATFVDSTSCMGCEYDRTDVVLCMGGYNTMVEVVQAGRPMLVYPRVEPRLEQYIRARRFAAKGLCEMLDPNCVNPDHILDAVERLLTQGAAAPARPLNLNGLPNVAGRLADMEASIRDAVAVFV